MWSPGFGKCLPRVVNPIKTQKQIEVCELGKWIYITQIFHVPVIAWDG